MIEYLNQLHHEDCLETMGRLPSGLINLTITSPPYNVDLGNDKYKTTIAYKDHNDDMSYDDYLLWLKARFELLFCKTASGGRVCVNIGNQRNGRVPLVKDFICLMLEIGWLSYTQIVWNKNQCSPRTAWGSFLSPSSPSFPTPFEFILVFCKDSYKLLHSGITDLTKQEFIDFSLALWTMPTAKKSKTGHPAAFPKDLPYRCMKMFSYLGDIIYDPFAGSGTTLIVSSENNRRFLEVKLQTTTFNYIKIINMASEDKSKTLRAAIDKLDKTYGKGSVMKISQLSGYFFSNEIGTRTELFNLLK